MRGTKSICQAAQISDSWADADRHSRCIDISDFKARCAQYYRCATTQAVRY